MRRVRPWRDLHHDAGRGKRLAIGAPLAGRLCRRRFFARLPRSLMHLSTHNWMRAEPLDVTLRRIKRLGFESLEISGEPKQYPTKATRALLKEHGIRCWGSVTLTLGERNLAATDAGQRARTVDYMKSVVTMVQELEGTECSVVPVTVGKIVPDSTPEQEWQWVVDGLRELYAHAKKCGVRLALEPINRFETYFLNRHDQAIRLAQEVGPDCGICLDIFHMNIEEVDMYVAIKQVGKRLVDVHCAENNRLAPGMGNVDWKRLVATLREVGYDGALTMEAVAPVDRTPASPWPDQIEKNPVDITPEQLKFIQDHGSSLLSESFYTRLHEIGARTLLPLIR
jgi:sugar phosphate isomerase/epimerase